MFPQTRTSALPVADSPLSGSFEPPLLAMARGNAVLTQHFVELQTRIANLVGAEIAERQREFAMTMNSLTRLFSWSWVNPRNAVEMQEIGRRWGELALITQSALVQAVIGANSAAGADMLRHGGTPAGPLPMERRVSARVIQFPDRRAAGR